MPPNGSVACHDGSGSNISSQRPTRAWKLRICPVKPLHDVPFLLTSSPQASLFSLRERIAKVLQKYYDDEGPLKSDQIVLFITYSGTDCALMEDGPIEEVLGGDGERIEVRLDEVVLKRQRGDKVASGSMATSTSLGKRQAANEETDDEDILLEANRIAQKIKTEIGPNGSSSKKRFTETVEEPEWPAPPTNIPGWSASTPSSLPLLPMSSSRLGSSSGNAAAAMKAFEEQKERKQMMMMQHSDKTGIVQSSSSSSSSPSSSSGSSSSSSNSSSSDSDSGDYDSSSSSEEESSSEESSSSSSESSSESSSSSDSSSSSSDSDSEDDQSSSHQTSITTAPTLPLAPRGGWVPPGKGLARTQRKNQSRREKRKEAEQAEKEQRFQEAKSRAEKRQKGEEVDEDAAGKAWTIDTKGSKTNGHLATQQKFTVVARDAELVLPPGGGSFGLPVKMNGGGKVKAKIGQTHPPSSSKEKADQGEQVQEGRLEANESIVVSKTNRQPPPPSMRNTKIPAGVKLTSVDCDDWYYNSYLADDFEGGAAEEGDEEDEVSEAYAAFQAKAKESLRLAREKDDMAQEVDGMPDDDDMVLDVDAVDDIDLAELNGEVAVPDVEATWLDSEAGSHLLTDTQERKLPEGYGAEDAEEVDEVGWVDEEATELDAARVMFPDLPMAFGKKDNWDGNEPLQKMNGTQGGVKQGLNTSAPAETRGEGELDYGDPEDAQFRPAGVHRDIEILRNILDEERAKRAGGKTGGTGGQQGAADHESLKKAREAALATLRSAKPPTF